VSVSDRSDDLRFAIVVVSPPEHPALHLQALAVLARVLKHATVRQDLLHAEHPEEIVSTLKAVTRPTTGAA
jgi:mannitol/fructose-specific phosphotransferase system IIA component (Ntr-type)